MLDFGRIKNYAASEYAVNLTGISRTLLASLLSTYADRELWEYNDGPPSDVQWNETQAAIDYAVTQILTPLQTYPIGGIAWQAHTDVEDGWLLCDGSVLNIADYPLLAGKLGTTYGGNGTTTFGVPNLVGRFARGGVTVGGTGGEDAHTLSVAELPAHTHGTTLAQSTLAEIDVGVPTALAIAVAGNTGSTGSGTAHENRPPYLNLYPIIKAFEVALSTLPEPPAGETIPVGMTLLWNNATVPTKYLRCDGALHETASYPALFALLGYYYGGSGSQFRVPTYAGMFPVGQGAGIFNSINAQGGEQAHTLTAAELPAHTHDVYDYNATGGAADGPQRTLNGSNAIGRDSSSVGVGDAHNNLPPYVVTLFIIRALP